MTDETRAVNISDEYTPNRQERLRAAKKQKEERNKITKKQLWQAIEELNAALGATRSHERALMAELNRERTALAVILTRLGGSTLLAKTELDDIVGAWRLDYEEVENGFTVELLAIKDDGGEEE
jgi:hypothetical protein